MTDTPDPSPPLILPTVRPGDVVQVTDRASADFGAIMLVTATFSWGFGATMRGLVDGRPTDSYHRLRVGEVARVGSAPLLPPDVAAARRAAIETERAALRDASR